MNIAPSFPTLTYREMAYPAVSAQADGFPDGWTARRVPRSGTGNGNGDASVPVPMVKLFYSPELKLKFRSRPMVRNFLDLLERAGGSEAAAVALLRPEGEGNMSSWAGEFANNSAMAIEGHTDQEGRRTEWRAKVDRKVKICARADCTHVAKMGGFCRSHGPRCAVDGCENAIVVRGVCNKHDIEAKVHREVAMVVNRSKNGGPPAGNATNVELEGVPTSAMVEQKHGPYDVAAIAAASRATSHERQSPSKEPQNKAAEGSIKPEGNGSLRLEQPHPQGRSPKNFVDLSHIKFETDSETEVDEDFRVMEGGEDDSTRSRWQRSMPDGENNDECGDKDNACKYTSLVPPPPPPPTPSLSLEDPPPPSPPPSPPQIPPCTKDQNAESMSESICNESTEKKKSWPCCRMK